MATEPLNGTPSPRRHPRTRHAVRHWRRAVAGAGLMALALPSMARVLVVCVPENPMPPFVYTDHEGEVQALVREAVAQQGDSAQFVHVPWKRCRKGLQTGAYMAAMPMAATAQDQQDFSFPQKRGSVDERLRLGDLSIGVVTRAGSPVDWDGHAFTGLNSPVLVLPAQMLARSKLAAMDVAEDAQAVHATSLLHMLVAGRRDAAVLPMSTVEQAMASGEAPSGLKLFPQPLTKAPVFLSFNRSFTQTHPGYAQRVWDGYARLNTTHGRPAFNAKDQSWQSAWADVKTLLTSVR